MTTSVFALCDRPALNIWREAAASALSSDPIVRGIIDQGLGFIYLGTACPQDSIEERIIRLQTDDPRGAFGALAEIPGVLKVAVRFGTLTAQ
jgi:hypothetical protein